MLKKNIKLLQDHGVPIFGDLLYRGDCLKEVAEQINFLSVLARREPELREIAVHIRNEGEMSVLEGKRHNDEGRKKGAPDIIIPSAMPFLMELKRRDHSKSSISMDQVKFLIRSKRQGAFPCVALGLYGAVQAFDEWLKSLNKF